MKISKTDVLELFTNNISQFVFWKDLNSIYQGCNINFAKYAGFDNPKEIIGKTDYDMPWSCEEADFFVKIDKEVMSNNVPQLNFEEPQTLKDGSTRWISTSKIPLHNNDKKVIGILGWYIDITPYRSMEFQINKKNETLLEYSQSLQKSRNELELSNRDMQMFTYAVSHDLKSPINNIISFTKLILKTYQNELNSKVTEKLNIVLDSGKSMNNLVRNILTYARTGLEEIKAKPVRIRSLVEQKLMNLDQILLHQNTTINIDFKDNLITCYPDLLGIVFYNLIDNALKYNESKFPRVDCTMEDKATEFIFSIKDNGIGIKCEYVETIFKPFKRLHSSQIAGSGLGLSICKRIIELHKGRIWIDDSSEVGTIFKFIISKNIS